MNSRYRCTFSSTHFAVGSDALEAYVSRTGIDLPEEYREFLLVQNGGIPSPQQADIPNTNHSVLVDYLYGILAERRPGDLEYETQRMSGCLPSGFVVIGHDPGGNAFLLATRADDRGRIYFWDKRGLPAAREDAGNTFWLADSISALLNSLYRDEGNSADPAVQHNPGEGETDPEV